MQTLAEKKADGAPNGPNHLLRQRSVWFEDRALTDDQGLFPVASEPPHAGTVVDT